MLLLLLVLVFCLVFVKVSFCFNCFNPNYLDKNRTNAIKGVFILLIVLSHSLGYIRDSGYVFTALGDKFFLKFFNLISQLVVVMFLFYSGYGVSESYKKKGKAYLQAFPKKRILTTLLNFDVAVVLFIILNLCLGVSISLKVGFLSLLGWESVGNSNWYIFVILFCYFFSFIVLRIPLKKHVYKVTLLFALCLFLIVVLSRYKGSWWYNTIMSYPMGFVFSTYKERFEGVFKRWYWLVAVVLVMIFMLFHFCPNGSLFLPFNFMSISFALLCVLLTLKIDIKCPVLRWFGAHLFPVYIYMRIPMLFIEHQHPELIAMHPAFFVLISLVVTVMIASLYRFWQIKL